MSELPLSPYLLSHLVSPRGLKRLKKEQWNQSLLTGASLAASTTILIIRSVCRHQSQIIPIYVAAYHHIINTVQSSPGLRMQWSGRDLNLN